MCWKTTRAINCCLSGQKAKKYAVFTRSTMDCFTVLQYMWHRQALKTIFNSKRPRDYFLWWPTAHPWPRKASLPLLDVSELGVKKLVMLAHTEHAVWNFHGSYEDPDTGRWCLLTAVCMNLLWLFPLPYTSIAFCPWAMLPIYISSMVVFSLAKSLRNSRWFNILSHQTSCTHTS